MTIKRMDKDELADHMSDILNDHDLSEVVTAMTGYIHGLAENQEQTWKDDGHGTENKSLYWQVADKLDEARALSSIIGYGPDDTLKDLLSAVLHVHNEGLAPESSIQELGYDPIETARKVVRDG